MRSIVYIKKCFFQSINEYLISNETGMTSKSQSNLMISFSLSISFDEPRELLLYFDFYRRNEFSARQRAVRYLFPTPSN